MSTESLDAADTLIRPLLPVNHEEYSKQTSYFVRSDTYWRESLIATLCCFPLGLISLCFSSEVHRLNDIGDFDGARKASQRTESLVKLTYRFSAILYVTLVILLLGLIEGGILVGIEKAHTTKH